MAGLLAAILCSTTRRTISSSPRSSPPTGPTSRRAEHARFYLDRLADPNLLTRDVGRLFLGRDLQCAQCHDHPLIDDYKQAHYYGIFAFLNRTALFEDETKTSVLTEKAEGDVTFTSVFKKKVTHKTGPRILDGRVAVEPSVPKGAEYLVPPDKQNKVRPIPRHSRRADLARLLTSNDVPEFSRNIVNRLWALLMGRGLVHPVDLHHAANPPADAELLDLLAREFVAMRYDMKTFLRELALTRVYQRSSEPPPGTSPNDDSARGVDVRCRRAQDGDPRATGLEHHAGARPGRADAVAGRGEARRPRPQDARDLANRRPPACPSADVDRGGRSRPIAKERHAIRAAVCRRGRSAAGRHRADGPPGPLPE